MFSFDRPGWYLVKDGEGESFTLAANLPASESDLVPVLESDLASRGVVVADGAAGPTAAPAAVAVDGADEAMREERVDAENREADQKLWRWLIVGLFFILIIETIAAGRRRSGDSDAIETGATV
jgi:hypothetical protein